MNPKTLCSPREDANQPEHDFPGLTTFILFPAVAVLLGWGLRGYIGGGPFAAMIPGCFLALSLSLLLGHDRNTAAIAALFGTIAIGYGGEMTYGQTLGLATNPATMGWGMLGVTVKGAIWGLLGGAVLGAGLTWRRYEQRDLVVGLVLTVVFFFVGWKLVNEPRLIYFSDPVNRPREESWAGLLFAAVAFLSYLSARAGFGGTRIPWHFALWGALGGGLGFGGGTLFLVYGPALPVPQAWFGWWKAMEFFFGLLLGGFFGLCAWLNRRQLETKAGEADTLPDTFLPVAGLAAQVAVYFLIFPFLREQLVSMEDPGLLAALAHNLFRPVYTFVFFGAVCIVLGLRSLSAAWQVAITATFFHTVVDLNRNWDRHNGFDVPWGIQALIMGVLVGLVALAAWRMQDKPGAVPRLYLLLLLLCYGMSCVRTFVQKEYFFPDEGARGGLAALLERHPGILPIHAIFTVSALITTGYIWALASKQRRSAPRPGDASA